MDNILYAVIGALVVLAIVPWVILIASKKKKAQSAKVDILRQLNTMTTDELVTLSQLAMNEVYRRGF